ncbi:hypothetical protein AC249_AIPGENE1557, partial [Exaiptasia diaphana]
KEKLSIILSPYSIFSKKPNIAMTTHYYFRN